MVKSWANDFVDLYETEFAHKINWDQLKQEAMVSGRGDLYIEEKRDGWSYSVGAYYWPKNNSYNTELYEISFKKHNYGIVKTKKELKKFSMWGYKAYVTTHDKGQHIKRGEWLYNAFDTKI